ncbi:YciI family protein [Paucisalibacillus sp. EB02]|uniref:YciI family protein n=1 Tax=Paucisalibacillus sp. EB02 TaxID=1347087 RepID=UPI0004B3E506|nr:YciI family protein [Paucisalibacillus sp. EB02]
MRYFAVFLPMRDEEKSRVYRPDHLTYLQQKLEAGNVFAKGPFVDGTGGLVIYKAESFEQVELMVKQDPYVAYDARGYEIHEWAMSQE